MSTLTKEKPKANFLINEKAFDWRYQTYERLSRSTTENEEIIHWLGIIDLTPIRNNDDSCPMYFPNRKWVLVADHEEGRDVDGAESGKTYIVPFGISKELRIELLKAREEGDNFFHVFLEECVDNNGRHSVSLLYQKGFPLGLASKKPWFEELGKDWVSFTSQPVAENLLRVLLVSNERYNWLK